MSGANRMREARVEGAGRSRAGAARWARVGLVWIGGLVLTVAAGCGDTIITQGEACEATPGAEGALVVECPGVDPIVVRDGVDAEPCSIEDAGDGMRRIRCGESSFVVRDGMIGDPGQPGLTGLPGATGRPGLTGPPGEPCTAENNEDGTWTLQCPDSDPVVVADAAGCTVVELDEIEDADFEMTCPDGSRVRWSAGTQGPQGEPGASCTITDNGDDTWTFQCPDQDPVTLRNGLDGDSCVLTELGDGEY